jgi:S1-C subfamily serine protease
VVLVASQYTNTVSGAIPLSIPTSSTTTGYGSATAYGSAGAVTVTGTSTSTTTGSKTVYMPYAVRRADFGALYFARVRSSLGLYVRAADDSTRQRLQTNAGVSVVVVIQNTPAFNADILPGDILLQINDDRVYSQENYSELVQKYAGSRVRIRLDRAGRIVQKELTVLR